MTTIEQKLANEEITTEDVMTDEMNHPWMSDVDEQTLLQVVRDICETMLGLPLTPGNALTTRGSRWVPSIRISGDTEAVVEIETNRHVAQRIATRMFGIGPNQIEEDDLRDALGEVVNMIGGNLKGLLPGECNLSLPKVEERLFPSDNSPADALSANLLCDGMHHFHVVFRPERRQSMVSTRD